MTDPILSRTPLRFARGELVFGYRLVRKLGEGSFGSVWLAANEKGFEWALKLVSLQGSGGIKEFKALQLIKDRKINNTNLLKLIDYGLLDHDGNSLASSAAPPIVETPPALSTPVKIIPVEAPRATPQGTLLPDSKPCSSQTAVEKLAARETQGPGADTKTTDDKTRAAWLVIVMEVGQLTLHQLQLQQTERALAQQPRRQTRAVTRMGVTAGGSQTIRDGKPTPLVDPLEEPLVPLPVATVLPYLEQAARGLDYLHRHEIVHRDIKPQNIILVGDDAKVCDYGLASESTNSTATTIGCTPAYAAPEAINNRPVPASDQYSLAVTYIELITGRWPFFGVTQTAIYREKDEGRHNLGFIRNRRTRAVLKRALAKLPQERFPTCAEFMQQLIAAEKSGAGTWSPLQIAGVVLAIILLAIGGIGLASQAEWWQQKPVVVAPPPVELPLEIPAADPDPATPQKPEEPVPPEPEIKPAVPAVVPTENLPAKRGDEALTQAFADAKLPPRELLRVLEAEVASAADPTEWFVALRNKAEENPALYTATEQWLQRNLNRAPLPESLDSSEYRAFEQEFRAASLQRMFNRPLPNTADLENVLSSPALRLNDSSPLAVLLRVDCEMRLAGEAATKAQLETWEGQIESAQIPTLPGKLAAQRSQFLVYLHALRLPARGAGSDLRAEGDKLQELFNASPQPAWLTPDRKQQLAEPLGLAALHELGKTDRDLPEIAQFQFSANKRLSNLLTIAQFHQLHGNSLAAVQAIVATSAALQDSTKADWPAIAELANTAFHDPPTNNLLATQQRRLLLFYAVKLSAIHTAKADSNELRDAVKGFATLLEIKQDGGPLFFDFDAEKSQANDGAILRTFIEPVLQKATQLEPASLALLWGAKGRILQRSPALAMDADVSLVSAVSPTIRPVLVANRAFERARELSDLPGGNSRLPKEKLASVQSANFRTLPMRGNEATHAQRDLLAIVEAFDPKGTSSDPELMRLGGYVRRQQAYQEKSPQRRSELVRDAASRYEKCLATQSLSADLAGQASSELADLHLNLANWTELSEADYAPLSAQTQPPLDSKSYHLWRAAALATSATKSSGAEKAEAFATLAAAREQMAFALGLLDNYAQAIAACDQGLTALPAKSVGANALQAIKGRCLMRHGLEMFSELTPDQRQAKLQQSIVELEAALSDRRTSRQWQPQDAETLASLAEAHIGLAADAARAQRLSQAENALRTAIEAADPRSPRLSHYRWRLLLVLSNQEGPSLRPAQQAADEIFVAIEKSPADQDPAAIIGIATTTASLFSEPSKLLRFLPDKGPWRDQWRSSDAWKLEAARLYSDAALTSTIPELRRNAQQLALELPARSQHRRLAEAYLQDNLAQQLCREFERMKPPSSSTASENSQRTYEADRQAKAGIATGAIHDCVQKHWDSLDARVQGLLAEINRASLADLQAGKILPSATVLEKRALWKYVTTAPSIEAREKYLEICKQHGSLMTAGNDLNRPQLATTSSELVKPVFYFATLAPQDARVEAFIKRHKPADPPKKSAEKNADNSEKKK